MSSSTPSEHSPNGRAAGDSHALLAEVRARLSRVTHDVNNPLAIISGNAQYVLELARVMELDADVVRSIRDIEEASQRLVEMLGRLSALKEEIVEVLDGERDTL